jgi:hypothetical protein
MALRTDKFLLVVKKLHAVRDVSLVGQSVPAVSFELWRLSCDWKLKAFLQRQEQRKNKKASVQDIQLVDESEDLICRGQVSNRFLGWFSRAKEGGWIFQDFVA